MKPLAVSLLALVFLGCSSKPILKYSTDTYPMILLPASQANLIAGRSRFREIYCAIAAERGQEFPDDRPCDDVLVRLRGEAEPSGRPVNLAESLAPLRILAVPGFGWSCLEGFLDSRFPAFRNVEQFGYEIEVLDVEPLSSSARNAQLIRDAVIDANASGGNRPLVLIGYSKGAVDILESIAAFPELEEHVVAVVSVAGAIGGSPLANIASQSQANFLALLPGSDCVKGDEGAVRSLNTSVRKEWLANHSLPESVRFYSLVTYPAPDEISSVLKSSYDKLSQIDPRNDSQIMFYDQIIPGSVLMGFLNADHWAVSVPVDRDNQFLRSTVVDKNAFPREVAMEAIIRFVDEDLASLAE